MSNQSYYTTKVDANESQLFSQNAGLNYIRSVPCLELSFTTLTPIPHEPPTRNHFIINSIETSQNHVYNNEQLSYPTYSIYVFNCTSDNAPEYSHPTFWSNPMSLSYNFSIDGMCFKLNKNSDIMYYTKSKFFTSGIKGERHYNLLLPDGFPFIRPPILGDEYPATPIYDPENYKYMSLPPLYIISPDVFLILVPKAKVQLPPASDRPLPYNEFLGKILLPSNFLNNDDLVSISSLYKPADFLSLGTLNNGFVEFRGSKFHNTLSFGMAKNSYSVSSASLNCMTSTGDWVPFLTAEIFGNKIIVKLVFGPNVITAVETHFVDTTNTTTNADGSITTGFPNLINVSIYVDSSMLTVGVNATIVRPVFPNPYYAKDTYRVSLKDLSKRTSMTHSFLYDVLNGRKMVSSTAASDAIMGHATSCYIANPDVSNTKDPLPFHIPGSQLLLVSYDDFAVGSNLFVDEYLGLSDNIITTSVNEISNKDQTESLLKIQTFSNTLAKQLALARKSIIPRAVDADSRLQRLAELLPTLVRLILLTDVHSTSTSLDFVDDMHAMLANTDTAVESLRGQVLANKDSILDLYNRIKNIHPLVPSYGVGRTIPLIDYSMRNDSYFLYNEHFYLPFEDSLLRSEDISTMMTLGTAPQTLYFVRSFDRLTGNKTLLLNQDGSGTPIFYGTDDNSNVRFGLLFILSPTLINVLGVSMICVDTSDKTLSRSVLRDWIILASTNENIGLAIRN